jgi:hypothetical protein
MVAGRATQAIAAAGDDSGTVFIVAIARRPSGARHACTTKNSARHGDGPAGHTFGDGATDRAGTVGSGDPLRKYRWPVQSLRRAVERCRAGAAGIERSLHPRPELGRRSARAMGRSRLSRTICGSSTGLEWPRSPRRRSWRLASRAGMGSPDSPAVRQQQEALPNVRGRCRPAWTGAPGEPDVRHALHGRLQLGLESRRGLGEPRLPCPVRDRSALVTCCWYRAAHRCEARYRGPPASIAVVRFRVFSI